VELLASGREAEVYAVDGDHVLRRFRDPARSAAREAELLGRLGEAGYPVPGVVSWDGPDLVLERIVGPRLSEAIAAGELSVQAGALLLADLHDRLHALPWDGGCLLHIDLHPENVLMADRGPVVIDWTNAREGDAGLDVAMSGLILAQVAVGVPALTDLVTELMRSFVRAVADDPAPYVAEALALRRDDPNLTALETGQLQKAGELLRSLS
jgi:aminoglycoside phosphotransferase (APT) family kinase protein